MTIYEYYKSLKESGDLDLLYRSGAITHVPILLVDVVNYHNAVKGKTKSPTKDTADTFNISRGTVLRYIKDAQAII